MAACILVICDQGGYKNHPTLPEAPGVRLTACSPLWATSSYSHTVRPSRTGLATNVVWNRHRRFKAWPETWHTSMTCLASGHYTVEAVWLARTDIFYITLGTCLYLSCMARGPLTQPAHQGVINIWMTARTSSHWPQPTFQHILYTHPSQPFRQSIVKQSTLERLLQQIYLPK